MSQITFSSSASQRLYSVHAAFNATPVSPAFHQAIINSFGLVHAQGHPRNVSFFTALGFLLPPVTQSATLAGRTEEVKHVIRTWLLALDGPAAVSCAHRITELHPRLAVDVLGSHVVAARTVVTHEVTPTVPFGAFPALWPPEPRAAHSMGPLLQRLATHISSNAARALIVAYVDAALGPAVSTDYVGDLVAVEAAAFAFDVPVVVVVNGIWNGTTAATGAQAPPWFAGASDATPATPPPLATAGAALRASPIPLAVVFNPVPRPPLYFALFSTSAHMRVPAIAHAAAWAPGAQPQQRRRGSGPPRPSSRRGSGDLDLSVFGPADVADALRAFAHPHRPVPDATGAPRSGPPEGFASLSVSTGGAAAEIRGAAAGLAAAGSAALRLAAAAARRHAAHVLASGGAAEAAAALHATAAAIDGMHETIHAAAAAAADEGGAVASAACGAAALTAAVTVGSGAGTAGAHFGVLTDSTAVAIANARHVGGNGAHSGVAAMSTDAFGGDGDGDGGDAYSAYRDPYAAYPLHSPTGSSPRTTSSDHARVATIYGTVALPEASPLAAPLPLPDVVPAPPPGLAAAAAATAVPIAVATASAPSAPRGEAVGVTFGSAGVVVPNASWLHTTTDTLRAAPLAAATLDVAGLQTRTRQHPLWCAALDKLAAHAVLRAAAPFADGLRATMLVAAVTAAATAAVAAAAPSSATALRAHARAAEGGGLLAVPPSPLSREALGGDADARAAAALASLQAVRPPISTLRKADSDGAVLLLDLNKLAEAVCPSDAAGGGVDDEVERIAGGKLPPPSRAVEAPPPKAARTTSKANIEVARAAVAAAAPSAGRGGGRRGRGRGAAPVGRPVEEVVEPAAVGAHAAEWGRVVNCIKSFLKSAGYEPIDPRPKKRLQRQGTAVGSAAWPLEAIPAAAYSRPWVFIKRSLYHSRHQPVEVIESALKVAHGVPHVEVIAKHYRPDGGTVFVARDTIGISGGALAAGAPSLAAKASAWGGDYDLPADSHSSGYEAGRLNGSSFPNAPPADTSSASYPVAQPASCASGGITSVSPHGLAGSADSIHAVGSCCPNDVVLSEIAAPPAAPQCNDDDVAPRGAAPQVVATAAAAAAAVSSTTVRVRLSHPAVSLDSPIGAVWAFLSTVHVQDAAADRVVDAAAPWGDGYGVGCVLRDSFPLPRGPGALDAFVTAAALPAGADAALRAAAQGGDAVDVLSWIAAAACAPPSQQLRGTAAILAGMSPQSPPASLVDAMGAATEADARSDDRETAAVALAPSCRGAVALTLPPTAAHSLLVATWRATLLACALAVPPMVSTASSGPHSSMQSSFAPHHSTSDSTIPPRARYPRAGDVAALVAAHNAPAPQLAIFDAAAGRLRGHAEARPRAGQHPPVHHPPAGPTAMGPAAPPLSGSAAAGGVPPRMQRHAPFAHTPAPMYAFTQVPAAGRGVAPPPVVSPSAPSVLQPRTTAARPHPAPAQPPRGAAPCAAGTPPYPRGTASGNTQWAGYGDVAGRSRVSTVAGDAGHDPLGIGVSPAAQDAMEIVLSRRDSVGLSPHPAPHHDLGPSVIAASPMQLPPPVIGQPSIAASSSAVGSSSALTRNAGGVTVGHLRPDGWPDWVPRGRASMSETLSAGAGSPRGGGHALGPDATDLWTLPCGGSRVLSRNASSVGMSRTLSELQTVAQPRRSLYQQSSSLHAIHAAVGSGVGADRFGASSPYLAASRLARAEEEIGECHLVHSDVASDDGR